MWRPCRVDTAPTAHAAVLAVDVTRLTVGVNVAALGVVTTLVPVDKAGTSPAPAPVHYKATATPTPAVKDMQCDASVAPLLQHGSS